MNANNNSNYKSFNNISNINDNMNNLIAENYYLKNILFSIPLLYQRLQNPFLIPPLTNITGPFVPIEEDINTKLKQVEDNTDINITSKNESIFNTKKYNLRLKSRIINSKDDINNSCYKEYKNSLLKEKSISI